MNNNLIMGIWKFNDRIPREQLAELAQKWAAEDPNYKQLYVRQTSKDQHGIGFSYERADDTKESYDEYFDRTSDTLKRQFGNDLVGWDLSSSATVIK
jgi:hypothetical protein